MIFKVFSNLSNSMILWFHILFIPSFQIYYTYYQIFTYVSNKNCFCEFLGLQEDDWIMCSRFPHANRCRGVWQGCWRHSCQALVKAQSETSPSLSAGNKWVGLPKQHILACSPECSDWGIVLFVRTWPVVWLLPLLMRYIKGERNMCMYITYIYIYIYMWRRGP